MRIKIWIEDSDGKHLEELGECLTDSPNRAVQMYEDECDKWAEKGYEPSVNWKDVTNPAAQALGSIRSPKRAEASRANGGKGSPESHRKGGRPKLK